MKIKEAVANFSHNASKGFRKTKPSSAEPAASLNKGAALTESASSKEDSPVQRPLAQNCPPEILLKIFHELSFENIKRARLVCKNWEEIKRDRIKITIKVDNSNELKDALKALRPGREARIQLQSSFKFKSGWENMQLATGVKSLDAGMCSELDDKKLAVLLKTFPNLEALDLGACYKLKFKLVDKWGNLKAVKKLNLACNGCSTDEGLLALLKGFCNLEELILAGNFGLKFDSVNEWPHFENVKKLDLSGVQNLDDKNLSTLLEKFPNLEELHLREEESLKFDSINQWPKLENFKKLDFSRNDHFTGEALLALLKKFSMLEELDISWCRQLNFNSIREWPNFENVKKINLCGNCHLTDAELSALREKFPNLEEINLGCCDGLKFNSLDELLDFENVKKLNLPVSEHLTDEKLPALLRKFPKLEELNLESCLLLKFDSLDGLRDLENLKNVKKLNLHHLDHLTDAKLSALLEVFPNLEELDLRRCDNLEFSSAHQWPNLINLKKIKVSGIWMRNAAHKKYPNVEVIKIE